MVSSGGTSMTISRRELLGRLAASAAAGVALQSLGGLPLVEASCMPRKPSPTDPVYLSGNENAYGPSKKVLAVMHEALSGVQRYPGVESNSLINRITALHKVKPEQIILGCGSSEVLGMAAEASLGPGKRLIQASPTCPLLGRFAENLGAEVVNVPLTSNYQHDLDTMLARSHPSAGLVYICNPNNPTGTITARKDIESFVSRLPPTTMVLIDEAYHEFVSGSAACPSFLDYSLGDNRIMVARTFSKIHG